MMINYVAIATNLITSGLGVMLGLVLMFLGYKLFDRFTPFNTSSELDDANMAVGMVVSSIFISISIMVSVIIGMVLG